MNHRRFFTQFSILTGICVLATLASTQIPSLEPHLSAAWFYLVFFVVFVLIAFLLGYRSALLPDKNAYVRYNLSLMFFKMLTCVAIVFLYEKLFAPPNHNHIIYFLAFYIIYSVFEYAVLSKLSYMKSE